jgi:ABC-type uncharacterized transport system ATPase subunit
MAGRVVMIHEGKLLLNSALDDLRENYSLALIPHEPDGRLEKLRSLQVCVSVRNQPDGLHAIFRCDFHGCRALLERELGMANVYCTSIALEEMFIELAGGRP